MVKRRSFLKGIGLAIVTAAVSTELAFKAFSTGAEGGIFNNLGNGNVHTYSELTLESIEDTLKDIFKTNKPNSQMTMWTTEKGMENFTKAMRDHNHE